MEGMLVEEIPTRFILFDVHAHHELDVLDSLVLGSAKSFDVARLGLVEVLPRAEVRARGTTDEHVWTLLPQDPASSVLFRGLTEIPRLAVGRVVDREVEREPREGVSKPRLAPCELRRDAWRRVHFRDDACTGSSCLTPVASTEAAELLQK